MSEQHYDYIVVGGGSAGCAAAYRLAERSDASVLLLESGGAGRSPLVRMPIGFAALMAEGGHNWNYQTEMEAGLAQRKLLLPRGRLMGGCSAINGMVYIRGQAEDYDGWAAAGNGGWAYDDVLPLFKRSERYWGGENHYHGGDGQVEVNQVSRKLPVCDAFIEAANQVGIPGNEDFNGASQEGVGYFDSTISRGRRITSASAFLEGSNKPDNLSIVTNFDAHRVIFDGIKARGVSGYSRGSNSTAINYTASQEIVLSAGALNTPMLLELSGVGDGSRLRKLGIEVKADLPEVGENLQDHCHNYLNYAARSCETYYDFIRPWRAPFTMLQYLLRGGGIFANPAALVGAFLRVDESASRPDAQIHFAAGASQAQKNGKLKSMPGVTASICRLQPDSRGSVHIASDNFSSPPRISGGYLQSQEDLAFQLRAIKMLREIFSQGALEDVLEGEMPPFSNYQSDADLLREIPIHTESVHHPVGSCRMGTDPQSVVTPALRVIGTEGLRVADASIMPRIISGNTHAACVMIGEKLADLVLRGA